MGNVINIILSNELYTILALCIIAAILFLAIKKLIKLLLYAVIILIVFLAYVYYSGKTVEKAVKKVEQVLK
jgi:Ca2+/Na+ antiporter